MIRQCRSGFFWTDFLVVWMSTVFLLSLLTPYMTSGKFPMWGPSLPLWAVPGEG